MKKQALIIAGIAVLTLGASIGVVSADTWNGSTGTSGAWSGTDDGATQVTATIAPSYTVTIPDSLTLPTTATYTENEDNVAVLAGAHVASDHLVRVSLAPGQTFAVAYQGTGTDNVAYKMQVNNETPVSASTDVTTDRIIMASATDAHAGTGTALGSLNVGFDSAPDFVFHGDYSQAVTFSISVVKDI